MTSLQSNAVSHWLGANLESALYKTSHRQLAGDSLKCIFFAEQSYSWFVFHWETLLTAINYLIWAGYVSCGSIVFSMVACQASFLWSGAYAFAGFPIYTSIAISTRSGVRGTKSRFAKLSVYNMSFFLEKNMLEIHGITIISDSCAAVPKPASYEVFCTRYIMYHWEIQNRENGLTGETVIVISYSSLPFVL